MPISVFTVGAMEDIWLSVNYAEADAFTCTAPALVTAQNMGDDGWILIKPINRRNGTSFSLPSP